MDKIINLGNGDQSLAECYKLHRSLHKALESFGGLQQPDRYYPDIKTKIRRRLLESEVKLRLKGIVSAFGYHFDDGFLKEEYQKIQDYVIKNKLYKGKPDHKSHADIIIERIEELEKELKKLTEQTRFG